MQEFDAHLDKATMVTERLERETDPGSWVELNEQSHPVFHEAAMLKSGILRSLEEAAGAHGAQAHRLHPDIRRLAQRQHR
jgi:hypothetical protein